VQFAIPLSRDGEPFFRQVYGEMRQAILSGALRAGERLPSTRDLAEQLGISRTVVVLAYEHLLAEGFIAGRSGSGTFVSDGLAGNVAQSTRKLARLRLSRFGNTVAQSMPTVDTPLQRPVAPRYNFIYGRSDLETFPFAMWRRMLLRQWDDLNGANQRWKFVTVSGLGPGCSVVLVSLGLRTHTIDDDKDHDTGIFVDVIDNDGNQIAYIANAQSNGDTMHYNPSDIKSFSFDPLRNDTLKNQCTNFKWRMGIQASGPGETTIGAGGVPIAIFHGGNDRWTFDAYLTLVFSDDTSITTNKLGQVLESNNGQLVWDDFN